MTSSPPLLECCDLDVKIGDSVITRNLNLRIEAGQCWCILGGNGSGKTTLLHTLAGLRPASHGTIALDGQPMEQLSHRQIAARLGILFQDQQDSFPSTVLEKVLQGRHPYLRAWQWESSEDKAIAMATIRQLDLEALMHRNVQTLSGGERQRTAIASLLAQQTALLLLDEPSNHLDLNHRLDILDALARRCREDSLTVLMSLHDINLAARLADHVLLLQGDGKVDFGPVETTLDTARLETLYGHRLIELQTDSGPAWLPR